MELLGSVGPSLPSTSNGRTVTKDLATRPKRSLSKTMNVDMDRVDVENRMELRESHGLLIKCHKFYIHSKISLQEQMQLRKKI